MALLPSIRIDIASGFNDKGFKKASRSANLLTRQFKQLGGTVAAALSVRAIANYSRAAVKAFAEEDAAVTKLTKTFKNLGLTYQAATANDFISQLQRQVAVSDDELRPALETLIRTTLDLGQAQKILGVALDVSAGTGYDLQKVTSALSKAYLGQGSALGKLNVGIGQVESKTISFNDALSRLQDRFGGQASAAVDTYAGKLKLLSIASEEAKESIGQRLLLALELLSKDQSIEGLTNDMEEFANKIGLAAVGLGDMLGQLNRKVTFGGRTLGEIIFAAAGGGFIDALAKKGAQVEYGVKKRTLGAPGAMQQAAKDAAIRKKALDDQKKTIALQKKAAAEAAKRERDAQALKRAGTIFDMDNIQIVAALQGKIDGEQRLRLVALLALNNGIAEAAEKTAAAVLALNAPALANLGVIIQAGDKTEDIISKLIVAQAKVALVDLGITNLPKAKNPFEAWNEILSKIIFDLDIIAAKIRNMPSAAAGAGAGTGAGAGAGTGTGVGAGGGGGNGSGGSYTVPNPFNPTSPPISTASIANQIDTLTALRSGTQAGSAISFLLKEHIDTLTSATTLSSLNALGDEQARLRAMGIFDTPGITAGSTFDPARFRRADEGGTNVTVIVEGSVISQQDLTEAITDQLYLYQKSGKGILYDSVSI
jgi:hypothetical protein